MIDDTPLKDYGKEIGHFFTLESLIASHRRQREQIFQYSSKSVEHNSQMYSEIKKEIKSEIIQHIINL